MSDKQALLAQINQSVSQPKTLSKANLNSKAKQFQTSGINQRVAHDLISNSGQSQKSQIKVIVKPETYDHAKTTLDVSKLK